MSTRPSSPLQAVETVRDARRADASRRMASAQTQLDGDRQRLRELERYRLEYEQAAMPASAVLLQQRARFLARLREAVEAQRRQVREAEAGLVQCRQQYVRARRGVELVQELQQRRADEARVLVERRLQQQADDRAGQQLSLRQAS